MVEYVPARDDRHLTSGLVAARIAAVTMGWRFSPCLLHLPRLVVMSVCSFPGIGGYLAGSRQHGTETTLRVTVIHQGNP